MSGRIRTIKPEWRFDEKLQGCSDEARVMSVCLITLSDDWGCGRASPGYLAGECWGQEMAREDGARAAAVLAKVSRALRELRGVDFVTVYEVGGQTYFHVTKWELHQRVDNRAKNRRIPAPPLANAESSRGSSESLANVSRGSPLDLDLEGDHGSGPRPGPRASASASRMSAMSAGVQSAREVESVLTRNDPKPTARGVVHQIAERLCTVHKEVTGRAWTHPQELLDALDGRGALVRTGMPDQVRAIAAHLGGDPDPVAAAERALRGWAADPWVKANRFPMAHLAKDPLKYLTRPVSVSGVDSFEHASEEGPDFG